VPDRAAPDFAYGSVINRRCEELVVTRQIAQSRIVVESQEIALEAYAKNQLFTDSRTIR
jgi:hypothetical protein